MIKRDQVPNPVPVTDLASLPWVLTRRFRSGTGELDVPGIIMNNHRSRHITVHAIAFGTVATLAFMGGTRHSKIRSNIDFEQHILAADRSQQDPNIITELMDDGTRILWIRDTSGRTLNQYNFASDGTLSLRAIYRIDASGSPLTCNIIDGQKTELFKVRYGYRKSDGMLVEEQIFDSRLKRLDGEGRELPVRRIFHVVDTATGKPKRELIDLVSIDFPQDLYEGFSNPFRSR